MAPRECECWFSRDDLKGKKRTVNSLSPHVRKFKTVLDSVSWIPDSLSLELGFRNPIVSRIRIPWAVFRIPKTRIPEFASKTYPGFPYLGRSLSLKWPSSVWKNVVNRGWFIDRSRKGMGLRKEENRRSSGPLPLIATHLDPSWCTPFSSAETFLCRREAGERKKARARWEGKREEARPTFSLFPLSRFRLLFSIIAIFIGIPNGSFCGGERKYANFWIIRV